MALAYLILAHKEPAQVELLFRTLYHPDDTFVLHFDRRAPSALHALAKRLAREHPNVSVLKPRIVLWGGFEMAAVQMDAMRRALAVDRTWTHFVGLTGQGFPLKKRSAIISFFAAHLDRSFVAFFDPMENNLWKNARERIERHHLEWPWLHWILSLPGIGRRLRALLGWTNRLPRVPFLRRRWPRFFRYFGGANHIVLSRAAATYLTTDPVAQRIVRWLRPAAHANEIVFQSALCNSPLRDTLVNDHLRYIAFPRPDSPHPKTLTMEDLPILRASNRFWARKFDLKKDPAILAALAADVAETPHSGDQPDATS